MSFSFVDECHEAIVGHDIFVRSVGHTGVQLTVWRVMNKFNEDSCPCSLGSWFFAECGALLADCETLVTSPDKEEG